MGEVNVGVVEKFSPRIFGCYRIILWVAMGNFGAFAFYGPALTFSYVLLFRMKEKVSLSRSLPLTLLTIGMGTMNLVAGAQNFQVFVATASLATGVRYGLLTLIVTLNLAVLLTLKRITAHTKHSLNLKKT